MYTTRPYDAATDASAAAALTSYPWSWLEYDAEAFITLSEGDGELVAIGLWVNVGSMTPPYPGIGNAFLFVAPSHRRRGIGRELLGRAEAFAAARKLSSLRIGFFAEEGDTVGHDFLTRHGFTLWKSGNRFSHVNLTTFDPAQFAEHIAAVRERNGVRFLTFAEAGTSEENWRRLHALEAITREDLPENREIAPYERWRENLAAKNFAETTLLAVVEDQWVGTTGIANHRYTGVLRAWRGRGIATAMKAEALTRARARGEVRLDTHNHRENGPILAVNRKLGYVIDPLYHTFEKKFEQAVG